MKRNLAIYFFIAIPALWGGILHFWEFSSEMSHSSHSYRTEADLFLATIRMGLVFAVWYGIGGALAYNATKSYSTGNFDLLRAIVLPFITGAGLISLLFFIYFGDPERSCYTSFGLLPDSIETGILAGVIFAIGGTLVHHKFTRSKPSV